MNAGSRPPKAPGHRGSNRPPPLAAHRLSEKRVLLGVSGSVAAYKAAVLARLLVKEGAVVHTVLTRSALEFVGRATFSGLTGHATVTDMFEPDLAGELHVTLARESNAIVLLPATADLIARLAAGRADDLLTATVLCATCPVLAAPAMHPSMWDNPATQRNVGLLTTDGRVGLVGPVDGAVASGDTGLGRMAEPETVLLALLQRLGTRDLHGRHIVVTAGPTVEDVDPVRFLSNRSSGKMGFALAERAAARGARVTLIAGPVELRTPFGVQRIDVRGAIAMRSAVWQALGPDLSHADALVMAAAVSDYRPAETRSSKMKRKAESTAIDLVQNPDILAEIGQARQSVRPVLVGFAVETGADPLIVDYAQNKLRNKRVDLVVANHAGESLGREDNRVTLVEEALTRPLEPLHKLEVADRLLDWVGDRLQMVR